MPPLAGSGWPIPLHSVPTKAPTASFALVDSTLLMYNLAMTVILFNWFCAGTQVGAQHHSCVTFTSSVHPVVPGTLIVMMADLELPEVLAAQVNVTFAFPVPEAGDTVHQLWSLLTVHAQEVDEIVNEDDPAVAGAE